MGKKGLKDIKNQNTNLVMQQIMQARSISRIELAQETGLSPSTVSSIVADLLGKGVIVETGTKTYLSQQILAVLQYLKSVGAQSSFVYSICAWKLLSQHALVNRE